MADSTQNPNSAPHDDAAPDEINAWLDDLTGQGAPPEKTPAQPEPVVQRFSTFSVVSTAIIVAMLGVIGYALYERSLATPTEGPAPDFSVTTFDGVDYSLEGLEGQVIVVNFWASFCLPCRAEAPMFERIWNEYADDGVVFLGINTEDPLSEALAYIDEFSLTYPHAPDKGASMENAYRVTGIPETFVINTKGEIVQHFLSEPNEFDFRAAIDRALKG